MSGTQNTRMYGDVKGDGQMNSISSLQYLQKMEELYEKINDDRSAFIRNVGNPSTWETAAETDKEFEADLNEYKKNVLDYE